MPRRNIPSDLRGSDRPEGVVGRRLSSDLWSVLFWEQDGRHRSVALGDDVDLPLSDVV